MSWADQLNALKERGLAHAAICDVNGASWVQVSSGSKVSPHSPISSLSDWLTRTQSPVP